MDDGACEDLDVEQRVSRDVRAISDLLPGTALDAAHVSVRTSSGGPPPAPTAAFDVERLLTSSAAAAVAAVDGLGSQRGVEVPRRVLDPIHVLTYCTTHVAVDGEPVPPWADLSGIYDTADDRSIQLHCNFPHHADGVVAHLGCRHDRASLAAAIAARDAFELEAELIEIGMVGAVVRTLDEWDAHPHAVATQNLPTLSVRRIDDAAPSTPADDTGSIAVTPTGAPLRGLRVLDCSRVLAGPTAGALLAGLGADVLRVGADHLPTVPVGVMATGFGKRTTSIDVRTDAGRRRFEELIADADVWIDAYRPGAFEGHGFSPERVAELRRGIVIVQISGFDWVGPWAGRRGFDSILQSTTGIRWAGGVFGAGATGPLGLPVQALDYATGFLAATAAAQLIAHQRREGGSWLARSSLLRTRNHLVAAGGPAPFVPSTVRVDAGLLHTVDSAFGRLTTVRPFVGEPGHPPRPIGSDRPQWLERR